MEDDMGVLSDLEPKEVFEQFEALSMVPRRTYRDEKISDYCVEFAKKHGLEYVQQESGNVIIYKPGTAGYEDSEPVILQGHMDMVASKTPESDHDFDTEPLELLIDGDYIGAKDTTLGGDDGIALAYAMAVLASDDIPHPPIEAVFTVDEEIGMGGAHALDTSLLRGKKLFNIDGEEDGVPEAERQCNQGHGTPAPLAEQEDRLLAAVRKRRQRCQCNMPVLHCGSGNER